MAIELKPVAPTGRQVIESYGASGFRVSGVIFPDAVLVLPLRSLTWAVASLVDVTMESLAPVAGEGGIEILLLGCGRRMGAVPLELRRALKAVGIVLEPMDSGAACRTYNVLAAEDRRVAAAILPAR